MDLCDESSSYGHAFYDYGNNIVAFCAERGQGKTTAMLSFSGELGSFNKDRERKNILEFKFKDNCYFEILESIDPTMLNDGVSVLKVFLSRLFYHLKSWVDNDPSRIKRSSEMVNKYNQLLSLFKKCFSTIENLSDDRTCEWDVDDLDTLSQIGDSSNLKKSIHELICLYFKITRKQKPERCFLVVQIDDADLAIASASDICEYIRKFLKIPGVIVLMAADYEQLLHAINRKYVDEYNDLLRYDESYIEICRKMSAKYLEKVLPYGHRVELPKIKDAIVEEHDKLKIQYNVNDVNQFTEEFKGCNDIQEQLIRLLYIRTGIILLKNKEKMHPFLPCRMRELTHFIKLLFDMEEVNHKVIYELEDCDERRNAVEALQINLQLFKQYFMRDWCINRLDKVEQQVIFRINEANKRRDDKKVYNVLVNYIRDNGKKVEEIPKKQINYRYIIKNLVSEELSDNIDLQAAVYLYYTIYLNNWFVNAVKDETQYEDIFNWMDYPLEVPAVMKDKKYAGKYHVAHFSFKADMKEYLEQPDTNRLTKVWMEVFCKAQMKTLEEKSQKLYVSVWDNDNQFFDFNPEIKELIFDVLQPLNTVFTSLVWKEWKKEEEKDGRVPKSSLKDELENIKENTLSSQVAGLYKCTKNIIANFDVQNYLMEQLEEKYQYINLRRKENTWKALCLEIYANIDIAYKKAFGYLGDECRLQSAFEHVFGQQKTYAMVFLSNTENKQTYITDYRKRLGDEISEITTKANRLRGLNREKLTEMLLQDDNFFRAELRNVLGPGVLESREDIASVDEDVKKLWSVEKAIIEVHQQIIEDVDQNSEDMEKLIEVLNGHIASLESISMKLSAVSF